MATGRFYYYGNRDYDHALEELEIAGRLLPNDSDVLFQCAALARAALGAVAQTYAMLGDADAAFPLLEHLLSTPAGLTPSLLKLDPTWDPLRNDPRFQKLVR
jgi:hypothetical protein